jgi:hypothetical protein
MRMRLPEKTLSSGYFILLLQFNIAMQKKGGGRSPCMTQEMTFLPQNPGIFHPPRLNVNSVMTRKFSQSPALQLEST